MSIGHVQGGPSSGPLAAAGTSVVGTLIAAASSNAILSNAGAVFTFLSPFLYLAMREWLANRGKARDEILRAIVRAELDEYAKRLPTSVPIPLPPTGVADAEPGPAPPNPGGPPRDGG